MAERDVLARERKVKFYRFMGEDKYVNAFEYLIENGELIDDMQISQFARNYEKFKTQVPIEKLPRIFKILKERAFGKDSELFP